ncbi:MAG: DHA2 family efflux MFS transporter permease subunit [Eggerthellaceae bacterium]|nr:DHA2 family efflux MFS transporter permease subunit [Eggerthellaceae bacterium]
MGLTRKQILMLSVLIVGTFVTVLNQTVVTPAIPAVMKEMSVDAATAQWLTTGFTLVNAIMIPITAYLTDRFSTRNLFLVSMGVFTAGSLLAGWGVNFLVLLAGRLVQAAGAGILMPMVMTVLVLTFPVDKRGTAMGIFGLVIAFAPAIGPTVAGVIIDRADWHIMFYLISVLAAAVVIAASFVLQRGGSGHNGDATLDKPSVILSTLGFGGLLYGFSDIGSNGIGIPAFIATLVGLISLVVFAYRQLTMKNPMLEVRVLKNRKFLVGTVIGMVVQASLLAVGILMPIYVQTLHGLSATVSGLMLLPGALIMGAMGPVAGRLFDKHGPRLMSIVGMTGLTLTTIAFSLLTIDTNLLYLTCLYAVRMFSLSLVNMPITTWGMNALENRLINHGTSVNNTLRQVAGSLGTAVIISVSTIAGGAAQQHLGMDATASTMLGINAAFGVCSLLCVVATVLVVALVKDRATDAAAEDPTGEHRTLLEKIMKRDVYFISENATVAEAMTLFVEKGISAMPVVNNKGAAVGFISDGDVMRALSSRHDQQFVDPIVMIMRTVNDDHGFDEKLDRLMAMKVKEIGAMGIIGVDIHAKLPEVCRVLGKNHLKKVPVLEDGRIVGIINRSDIAQYSMKAYLEKKDLLPLQSI